ncbi:MAG: hypothetical protein RMK01_08580 [Thermomicrobium sp.]|nr:hypothetical protein [Thermomicrobium sp.]MDW8060115.1 hypothetical protein [Thermomicrobium sp.]
MTERRPEQPEFIQQAREEERRRREEARQQAMQSQLDELRHRVRELAARQLRLEEELKAAEADWAEQRHALEQHRHETHQAQQARQLEEARFRQQLTELALRVDELTRPIRTLQAQVAELLDAVRRQREDTGQDTRRYDELRVLIEHLAAHIERLSATDQSLRGGLEAVTNEVERLGREVTRLHDAVRIVEQDVRRRIAEALQVIETIQVQLKEGAARDSRLEEELERVREELTAIPQHFEDLRGATQRLAAELERVRSHTSERDELLLERVEELRQQFDQALRDLAAVGDQRAERIDAEFEQLEAVDRELRYRIDLIELKLEELREIDRQLRAELWRLLEQRVRLRFEQAQQELEQFIEQRQRAERGEGTTT